MALNPLNAPVTTLTFTVAGSGTTTDALGNTIPNQATVTVPAIVTQLSPNALADIQDVLGSTKSGIPVKVRAATSNGAFPSTITRGSATECTLTYSGRPARLSLMVTRPNPHLVGSGLLASLGQSAVGLLSLG
jgi:hypothetical protein